MTKIAKPKRPPKRKPSAVSAAARANAERLNTVNPAPAPANVFSPYRPRPGVVPEGSPALAMDDASVQQPAFNAWAFGGGWSAEEGQQFLGFPLLSILAQRGENRLIAETIATEATRNWIEFKSAKGEDKTERIRKIEAEVERLKLKDKTRKASEHDSYFGRAHWFMDFGEVDGPELGQPIGDGLSALSKNKVGKGSLRDIRVIEPLWVYPQSYNASNALSPDFYRPKAWFALGQPVDASRLLTFVAREVPDLLKASYAFAGLSMTQMIRPYVDNWLDTRQGVTAIVKAFTTFVLSTNMADVLTGGAGDSFFSRIQIFNATRSNAGVLAIDKEREDFKNVSAPISGLEGLQAQSQEHMASIAQMPLVKLTGISPSGLNASGDQEMRCWEDRILAYQEAVLRPNLTTAIRFIQLSIDGEVDEDITFEFVPLLEMTEEEEADLRKTNAETGEILIRSKALSTMEERQRIVMDTGGPYHGLDAKAEVKYPMTEAEKAQTAATLVQAVTALVGEAIIGPEKALEEIAKAAPITGFGTTITEDDIAEAENDPPAPGETEPEDAAALKGNAPRAVQPLATKALKAEA